jgi:hypothetical protein
MKMQESGKAADSARALPITLQGQAPQPVGRVVLLPAFEPSFKLMRLYFYVIDISPKLAKETSAQLHQYNMKLRQGYQCIQYPYPYYLPDSPFPARPAVLFPGSLSAKNIFHARATA